MLWSPWVKVTPDAGQEYHRFAASRVDLLFSPLLDWGANAYIPRDVMHEAAPFISPLHHPFQTRTPLFIQARASEAFYPLIRSFAEELSAVESNRVRFHESELAPHDIFLSHSLLGITAQVEAAVDDARDFFENIPHVA